MVQTIKAQVEEGQTNYNAARAGWNSADQKAAAADAHAAETDLKLGDAQKKFDAVNKDNAKMRPVYLECTSKWGLGAIFFGIRDLIKHLLILAAVLAVLAIGIWILSIASPAAAPVITLALRAVGGVFSTAGRGIAAFFGMLHQLLQKLVAKLTPAPKPPLMLPVPAPIAPIEPVTTGPPAPIEAKLAAMPLPAPPLGPTGPPGIAVSIVPWIAELVAAENSVAPPTAPPAPIVPSGIAPPPAL